MVIERRFPYPLVTVNLKPLLEMLETITTTFPVVAPEGTVAVMLVALQPETVADVPLKVTVLLPCVEPKFVPVIVTDVPNNPETRDRLVRFGPPLASVPIV